MFKLTTDRNTSFLFGAYNVNYIVDKKKLRVYKNLLQYLHEVQRRDGGVVIPNNNNLFQCDIKTDV